MISDVNKRLLIRPRPHEMETWYGYLVRVSEKNGISNFTQIAVRYKSKEAFQAALMLSDEELHGLKGPPPFKIYKELQKEFESTTYTYSLKYLRWCPLCIETKQYHQVFWMLKFGCVCVIHKLRLQDKCPKCHQLQLLRRDTMLNCQYCGTPLSKASKVTVKPNTVSLQAVINNTYLESRSTNQFQLAYRELSKLVFYLGQFSDVSMPVNPGNFAGILELDYALPLLNRAADLLDAWPTHIQELMHKIQAQSIMSTSIKGHFGSLYHVFYTLLRLPAYQFLRDVFEDHLIKHWPSLINERNKALKLSTIHAKTRLTIKQMANLTGAEPSMIKCFIQTKKINCYVIKLKSGRQVKLVHIGQAEKIRNLAESAMTLEQVAWRLNIPKNRVREIIKLEKLVLLASKPAQKSAKWLIDGRHLKSFTYLTLPVTKSCIPIKQLFKSWKLTQTEFSALLYALQKNILRTYSETGGFQYLGNIWVERLDAKEWLYSYREANNQIISVDEAAKRLGIKQQVAYHLVKKGMIESVKSSNGKMRIRIEAVNTFKKQYISLLELSKQMKTSPNHARKQIVETPVCGPTIDGCRQYFYFKKTTKFTNR